MTTIMESITAIASTIIKLIFGEAFKEGGKALGKSVSDKIPQLITAIRQRFKESGTEKLLTQAEKQPTESNIASVEIELENQMSADPNFTRQLMKQLEQAGVIFCGNQPENIPHNIPQQTIHFVGRSEELQAIEKGFEGSAIQSITGMRGVGKTELAIQYTRSRRNNYQGGICWVKAMNNNNIAEQIVDFCSSIDAKIFANFTNNFTPETKVKSCYNHWPIKGGKALIIFDGVNSYDDIEKYLPHQADKFKVITTSCQTLVDLEVKLVELEVLKPEEALKLLKLKLTEERVNQQIEEAQDLCLRLDYLPLALEVVVRNLISDNSLSIRDLIKRLENLKLDSLIDHQRDSKARVGVESTFELSWNQLSPEAKRLGCYLSLFKSHLFNWSWIESSYLEAESEQASEEKLKKLKLDLKKLRVKELEDFKLLQRAKDGNNSYYSYQNLISYFFEKKLNSLDHKKLLRLKKQFCQGMVKLAQSISDKSTPQELKEVFLVVPHLKTVANEINKYIDDQDLVYPFIALARFYESQKDYQQAEEWRKKCLSICQERLEKEHPHVALSQNNLANLYYLQGKYQEAELLYSQALSRYKEFLGEEHLDVAFSQNNLANLYYLQGKYQEAEPLYLQALSLRIKLLGEEHLDVALSKYDLANLYFSQGKYQEAEPLYSQALSLRRKLLGEEHFHVVQSKYDLALLYLLSTRKIHIN